jgi:predicted tellurium resistance membrane protein TerC
MIELLSDPNTWIAFGTLTVMEIVLGIDNIVFISVLVSRLPAAQAERARKLGLALALIFRIALLLVLSWIIGLTQPAITAWGLALSWKDIILIAGGAFLVYKATHEMHAEMEEPHEPGLAVAAKAAFSAIILQIIIIDMVFSIDSIVTAVGMADDVEVMIAAVVVAVGIMFVASGPVAKFVAEHPTTKMLALAFLLLIGMSLVADGFGFHIPKGYIYSAMGFSVLVEAINIIARQRRLAATNRAGGSDSPRIAAAHTVPSSILTEEVLPAAARPKTKTTDIKRSQARPKSAPRKPRP